MRKFLCIILLFTLGAMSTESYSRVFKTRDKTFVKSVNMVTVSGTLRVADTSAEVTEQLDSTLITFYPYDKITLQPGPIEAVQSTYSGTYPEDTGFPDRYTITLSNNYFYKVHAIPTIEFPNSTGFPCAYQPQFYPNTEDITEADFLDLDMKNTEIDFLFQPSEDRFNWLAGNVYNENNMMTYSIATAYRIVTDSNGLYTLKALSEQSQFDSDFFFPSILPGEYIIKVHPFYAGYEDGYYSDKGEIVPSWEDATRIIIYEEGEEFAAVYLKTLVNGGEGEGEVSGMISVDRGIASSSHNEYFSSPQKMKGVRIYLKDESLQTRYSTYTDKNGAFAIHKIAKGNYKLFADKPGYTMQPYEFSVAEDGGGIIVDAIMHAGSITSVDNAEETDKVEGQIYPNPTHSDQVILQFPAHGKLSSLLITNTIGQVIFKTNIETSDGINTFPLNVSKFPSGVYSVIISTGAETIRLPQLQVVR